jgi:hypothetical protein
MLLWRVVPERTPHVVRPCPRCDARDFASSDKFRVNASGRKLDVWLIYRCVRCDFTWNLTVVERASPEAIGPARLAAWHENDVDAAWRCAFDDALLRRAGAQAERDVPVRVERSAPAVALPLAIRFELPFVVKPRLDRLLAAELAVPRSRLEELVDDRSALRRPVRDGQIVTVGTCYGPAPLDGQRGEDDR